jgi:hypothetical protein
LFTWRKQARWNYLTHRFEEWGTAAVFSLSKVEYRLDQIVSTKSSEGILQDAHVMQTPMRKFSCIQIAGQALTAMIMIFRKRMHRS